MAQSFTAQVRAWTQRTKREQELIVAEAAQMVFEQMSRRQPSVKDTGGAFEIGKVPVDTGLLINSMFAQVNGSTVGAGSDGYVAAIGAFTADTYISFNFSQEYAPAIEYGTRHFQGRFMVREALNSDGGWQGKVNLAAARYV